LDPNFISHRQIDRNLSWFNINLIFFVKWENWSISAGLERNLSLTLPRCLPNVPLPSHTEHILTQTNFLMLVVVDELTWHFEVLVGWYLAESNTISKNQQHNQQDNQLHNRCWLC
jgi:hypothetical protein